MIELGPPHVDSALFYFHLWARERERQRGATVPLFETFRGYGMQAERVTLIADPDPLVTGVDLPRPSSAAVARNWDNFRETIGSGGTAAVCAQLDAVSCPAQPGSSLFPISPTMSPRSLSRFAVHRVLKSANNHR